MRPINLLLLCGLLFVGCASRLAKNDDGSVRMFNFDPTTDDTSELRRVLKLEAVAPETVAQGTVATVKYELRNIGSERMKFCIDGQGVSTWISTAAGARFISTLYSVAFDNPCYTEVTLEVGGVYGFAERLVVPVGFPTGTATVHGTTPIRWPSRGVYEVIGTTTDFKVVVGSNAPLPEPASNSRLHPREPLLYCASRSSLHRVAVHAGEAETLDDRARERMQ